MLVYVRERNILSIYLYGQCILSILQSGSITIYSSMVSTLLVIHRPRTPNVEIITHTRVTRSSYPVVDEQGTQFKLLGFYVKYIT